jgi:hypothetical protein
MANEETKTEETEQTELEDNAQVSESDTGTEGTKTEDAGQSDDVVKQLTQQVSDLQSKYDTLAQDASRDKKLLEEVIPHVNFDQLRGGKTREEEEDYLNEDGSEEPYLTKAEATKLLKGIEQKIATTDFVRDFRTKFPDLADKGPKEEMVRYFFENKTLHTDDFDKRLESAVKAARELLKSEQDKGSEKTKAEKEKAAAEAKAKTEAAAKAAGLSSAGLTSPKTEEGEKTEETASDYVARRKEKLAKLTSNQT